MSEMTQNDLLGTIHSETGVKFKSCDTGNEVKEFVSEQGPEFSYLFKKYPDSNKDDHWKYEAIVRVQEGTYLLSTLATGDCPVKVVRELKNNFKNTLPDHIK